MVALFYVPVLSYFLINLFQAKIQIDANTAVNPIIKIHSKNGLCMGAKRFSNGKNKQSPSGMINVNITWITLGYIFIGYFVYPEKLYIN